MSNNILKTLTNSKREYLNQPLDEIVNRSPTPTFRFVSNRYILMVIRQWFRTTFLSVHPFNNDQIKWSTFMENETYNDLLEKIIKYDNLKPHHAKKEIHKLFRPTKISWYKAMIQSGLLNAKDFPNYKNLPESKNIEKRYHKIARALRKGHTLFVPTPKTNGEFGARISYRGTSTGTKDDMLVPIEVAMEFVNDTDNYFDKLLGSNNYWWLIKSIKWMKDRQNRGQYIGINRESVNEEEDDTLTLPKLNVGDELKTGRWKNKKSEITGFKKDKNNHPVAKTTKGDVQVLKPRVTKLMPEGLDLTEVRGGTLKWFTSKMPNVPAYVIRDFVYSTKDDDPEHMKFLIDLANSLDWKQETVTITMDFWNSDTQAKIKKREGGSKNPFGVPQDAGRHAKQKELLLKTGPSTEPIIIEKTSKGYELHEGWHRTIQSMATWPEGYKQIAWIGTKKVNKADQTSVKMVPEGYGFLSETGDDYLWHGSKSRYDVLKPRQAKDTGGASGSNQKAVYAAPDPNVAIAMGMTTLNADTAMFPDDTQMVLFKGNIRHGEMVYLHKVSKDLFIKHDDREWYSKPGVEEITPIEIKEIPVDKHLNLIRTATPDDLALQKHYLEKAKDKKEGRVTKLMPGGLNEAISKIMDDALNDLSLEGFDKLDDIAEEYGLNPVVIRNAWSEWKDREDNQKREAKRQALQKEVDAGGDRQADTERKTEKRKLQKEKSNLAWPVTKVLKTGKPGVNARDWITIRKSHIIEVVRWLDDAIDWMLREQRGSWGDYVLYMHSRFQEKGWDRYSAQAEVLPEAKKLWQMRFKTRGGGEGMTFNDHARTMWEEYGQLT